ncbi:TrbL/VirB6 family protein [Candidatus Hepatincola sp. Av]
MKKSFLIIFLLMCVSCHNVYASDVGGTTDLNWATSLGNMYQDIIDVIKGQIKENFEVVSKDAVSLLGSLAVLWIVVLSGRNFIQGRTIINDFSIKMSCFVGLTALLQFNIYEKYIVENLEILFNDLPTMFSSIDGNNVIEKVLTQAGDIVDKILAYLNSSSWLNILGDLIICAITIISVIAFTLVVVLNVLSNTVKFYLILSLGSVFILLSFFDFTRKFTVGAFSLVASSIFNMLLLTVFLKIYSEVILNQMNLVTKEDVITKAFILIAFNVASIFFINTLSEISTMVVGTAISSGKGVLAKSSVANMATSLVRVLPKIPKIK